MIYFFYKYDCQVSRKIQLIKACHPYNVKYHQIASGNERQCQYENKIKLEEPT